MFEIIPSPGTTDTSWEEIEKKIELVKPFAKTIHIDVIDGKFAPTTTFLDPEPFAKYTHELLFEVHLMVEEPITYLDAFAKAGFVRFIGQIEKMSDQTAFVAKAQQFGEVGLALDAKTSLDSLTASILDLDTVLIMTIDAGASGRPFQEEQLGKVKTISEKDSLFPVSVDGGIHSDTLVKAMRAGARRLVVTSELFGKQDPHEAYTNLHKIAEGLVG